ncbi:MAG: 4Fe-4S dicluster domain-containing protein [Anaerolineales bacterium]|nr:4Fe-4S dicluster domain-containing protein [Anaerolineales bacterium]
MTDTNLLQQINTLSSQTLQLCYHCHKCTAGCPVAEDMQYGPDRILRMVQLGQKERLLASHDIWLCAACETCGTRCPNEIDIARVMDALRQIAIEEGVTVSEPDALKFHKIFMYGVQMFGRSHEMFLFAAYKLWTMHLMDDMDSGIALITKGKVPIMPSLVKNRAEVSKLFKETQAREQESRGGDSE